MCKKYLHYLQRIQTQDMKIEIIANNLYREDKMICAVKNETSESMVNDVLAGRRNRETELGKSIMAELTRLSKINIQAKAKKNAI